VEFAKKAGYKRLAILGEDTDYGTSLPKKSLNLGITFPLSFQRLQLF
jgi:hypothetical protein